MLEGITSPSRMVTLWSSASSGSMLLPWFRCKRCCWLLSLTTAAHTPLQWLRQLSESQYFVSAALSQQLPGASPELHLAGFDPWQRLFLSESAYLSGWRAPLPQDLGEDADTNAAPAEENEEAQPDTAQGQIVERSFQASSTDAYEQIEGIYLQNRTAKQLDIAAIAAAEVEITLPPSDQPEILIIHTHGSEAYAQDGADTYSESDTAKTTDTQYNIIRVGDEIERIFTEMGLNVIHDRTLYDYPSYSGSYERSGAHVASLLATLLLFISFLFALCNIWPTRHLAHANTWKWWNFFQMMIVASLVESLKLIEVATPLMTAINLQW